jgi:hypothetical protein
VSRIAFVLPVNGVSGGIFVAYVQAHALQRAGHQVTLVFDSFHPEQGFAGYPDFALKHSTLQCVCEAGQTFDVLITTWWETFYKSFAIPAAHHLYFVQSDERRFYPEDDTLHRSLVELSYRTPNIGVITEARWIESLMKNEFGLPVEYAPNGVDTALFSPAELPARDQGRFRILIEGPGSFPYKRIGDAFAAAQQIADAEIWYVCTDGYIDAAWKPDKVLHKVPYREMPAVYRDCDVLLKLSAVEGFFGPPLEMMACGGVSVVSAVTGHEEYIVNEQNALVVPVGDIAGAVRALQRIRTEAGLSLRLRENGLATARAMDWAARSPLFVQALEALLARIPAGAVSDAQRKALLVTDRLRQALEKLADDERESGLEAQCAAELLAEQNFLHLNWRALALRFPALWRFRCRLAFLLRLLWDLPHCIVRLFKGSLRQRLAEHQARAELEASLAFDRRYYLTRYKDVARSGMDPQEHYLLFGKKEGRAPQAPQRQAAK